jgi:hypothetical protein
LSERILKRLVVHGALSMSTEFYRRHPNAGPSARPANSSGRVSLKLSASDFVRSPHSARDTTGLKSGKKAHAVTRLQQRE